MLKEIPGSETVQHLCETYCGGSFKFGKPTNPGEKDGVEVLMHDIHPYLYIKSTKQMIPITYCLYCGADIEKEERP